MNNNLSKLTVIIVTFKTDIDILKNCLKSVNSFTKILIVENSNFFEKKKKLKMNFLILRYFVLDLILVWGQEIILA